MEIGVFCDNCESVWSLRDVEQYFQENEDLLDIMNKCYDTIDEVISLDCSKLISHTLHLTMPCLFCEYDIEGITAEVTAEAEWDNHLDDERMPEFLGFTSIYHFSISSQFIVPIDISDQVECGKKSLIIVCKSKMYQGFCYIGLEPGESCLYRPIYRDQPKTCCWPQNKEMVVGVCYEFEEVYSLPNTILPHYNEDILVTESVKLGEFNTGKMYEYLLPLAETNLFDIFPQEHIGWFKNGGAYVREGTNCRSVGVLKIDDLSRIKFDSATKTSKEFLKITVSDNKSVNLRWTSTERLSNKSDMVLQSPEKAFLVIIGLGRGFNGNGKWETNRCSLLAVNMILK